MTIHIEDLKFQCIIGILDFERITPQNVIIQVEIEYHFSENFINYADVVKVIKNTMLEEKFLLIEDALKKIPEILKKDFQDISTLFLKITKPTILPECRVSVSDTINFIS